MHGPPHLKKPHPDDLLADSRRGRWRTTRGMSCSTTKASGAQSRSSATRAARSLPRFRPCHSCLRLKVPDFPFRCAVMVEFLAELSPLLAHATGLRCHSVASLQGQIGGLILHAHLIITRRHFNGCCAFWDAGRRHSAIDIPRSRVIDPTRRAANRIHGGHTPAKCRRFRLAGNVPTFVLFVAGIKSQRLSRSPPLAPVVFDPVRPAFACRSPCQHTLALPRWLCAAG